jgi:hypothetical protein
MNKINGTYFYTTLDTIGIECLEHCFQTLYNDSKDRYFDGYEDLYGLMEEYLEEQGMAEDIDTKINDITSSLTREQYRYLKELYYDLFESQQ